MPGFANAPPSSVPETVPVTNARLPMMVVSSISVATSGNIAKVRLRGRDRRASLDRAHDLAFDCAVLGIKRRKPLDIARRPRLMTLFEKRRDRISGAHGRVSLKSRRMARRLVEGSLPHCGYRVTNRVQSRDGFPESAA